MSIDRPNRVLVPLALTALAFLAACQSGDTDGVLGIGGGSGQPAEDAVTAEELRAFCPQVTIRADNAFYTSYERGGAQTGSDSVVYLASISDATRRCSYNGGMLGMNIALAGRVVPGPAGRTGDITLPINVTVLDGTGEIYNQTAQQQVTIADTAGATQFLFNDQNVSFPIPSGRNVRVFVGFATGNDR